jgi:hypothetical protein
VYECFGVSFSVKFVCQFCATLLEGLVTGADVAQSETLAVRDATETVAWVTGVERQDHVSVCGFSVEVCGQFADLHTDANIQKGNVDLGVVPAEFDGAVLLVKPV